MASRHELTTAEWARIAPLLPARETRGTYYADHRRVLNGILYRQATGCAWRDLPERYGPWSTVYSRRRRWTREGRWDCLLRALQRALADAGRIDWELWCIDGSHVRAHRHAAGAGENLPAGEPRDHALGRSRGGFTTKLHLVTDGNGLPLAVALSAGQAHESQHATRVLDAVRVPRSTPGRPRRRPTALAGDKGYSYPVIRARLRRRGIRTVTPERADQVGRRAHRRGRKARFDRAAYRRRSAIECTVGALKEARAVETRYEKLAIHYLALVNLGMVRLLLRRLEHPLSHRAYSRRAPRTMFCRAAAQYPPPGRQLSGGFPCERSWSGPRRCSAPSPARPPRKCAASPRCPRRRCARSTGSAPPSSSSAASWRSTGRTCRPSRTAT